MTNFSADSDSADSVFCVTVDQNEVAMRLDSFLVGRLDGLSRAKIQRAINQGRARVDGSVRKPSFKLDFGQEIKFQLPKVETDDPVPEDIPLDVVYEDEHVIGINKPPRMVVHPAKGHWSGTLTAALAFHFQELSSIGGPTRPGIVHRLDRDTSGIILVAKTDQAHSELSKQFEQRTVSKTYCAIVSPPPDRDRDHVDQPIGVHPYQREKMAIRKDHSTSRNASTYFEVQEVAGRFAVVHVQPKTGRTHQIRVHMAHAGSPVISDKLYSGHSKIYLSDIKGTAKSDNDDVILDRQALHALKIEFDHPVRRERMELSAPLADDIRETWALIKKSANLRTG